eukprot:TRINITY_DN12304_c0_g1_i1.p1 TRINITY_DN12304_c0_g1~~TRINITY_DN12304_c0_g1_i1.p1  ORF type:complete len:352 (+),score=31.41 TRINITY_DN12304_c0_g1_i1:75-1130(+)
MQRLLRILIIRPGTLSAHNDAFISAVASKATEGFPNIKLTSLPLEDGINSLDHHLSKTYPSSFTENDPEVLLVWNNEIAVEKALARFPSIKWIQNIYTGCDKLLKGKLIHIRKEVTLTNAKGVSAGPLAEYAIGAILYFKRKFKIFEDGAAQKQRVPLMYLDRIEGKRILIVGYGKIGNEIARVCKQGHKMHVTVIKRDVGRIEGSGWYDRVIGMESLVEAVAESDFVINALPSTPATRGVFSNIVFDAMKESSLFINVGRGECVDEVALQNALKVGKIEGAALDVTQNEPLQADNPWFAEDLRGKVLLTFHTQDQYPEIPDEIAKSFKENIESYLKGEKLNNVVDRDHGY